MSKKRIPIEVSPAAHAIAKRLAGELGITMSDVIGAALLSFEKMPERYRQQGAAVYAAVTEFWQIMRPQEK